MMNFHEEINKVVGASLLFIASIISLAQIQVKEISKDTPANASVVITKRADTLLKKLELKELAQDRKLDSLASEFDSTAIILKQVHKDKKVTEKVLDDTKQVLEETGSIQQGIISTKIPALVKKFNSQVTIPVKFKVRLVEPVDEYILTPKPVGMPEVVVPCPERPGFFKRLFKRLRD